MKASTEIAAPPLISIAVQVCDFDGGGIGFRCEIGNCAVRAFGSTHVLFVQLLLILKGLLLWWRRLPWLLWVRQIAPPNPKCLHSSFARAEAEHLPASRGRRSATG
jgi:hypothetical protein